MKLVRDLRCLLLNPLPLPFPLLFMPSNDVNLWMNLLSSDALSVLLLSMSTFESSLHASTGIMDDEKGFRIQYDATCVSFDDFTSNKIADGVRNLDASFTGL